MSPFDFNWSPDLVNKVSTQIDGQLPQFIADDHPRFSSFLKSYYQYLESGELQLTVDIDNVLLEVTTATNLLREDGGRVVTESGAGTTGKFVVNETITGGTSKATATVLVEDLGHATKPRLFITSQQKFETGETVTGGTSGATGTVTQYRASPVQNIQQLLAYADIDNTIYDFIEQFRESFMNAIPDNLATGIDKRNLVKNIKELYRRKGTKEASKLFMKILLDQDSEIFYPNQYMLRTSASDWDEPIILRCEPIGKGVEGSDLIGQTITGQNAGATALVEDATAFSVGGGTSYTEFQIGSIVGTFEADEEINGTSISLDTTLRFTVRQIFSTAPITNDGILYESGDIIDLDSSVSIGSGDVEAKVNSVNRGSVSGVVIDDAGTNYEVGDLVVFTDNSDEAGLTDIALGKVAVIHGSIIDETDSDRVIQEDGTNSFTEYFNVELERGTVSEEEPYAVLGTSVSTSTTQGYYYPIYSSLNNATESTISKATATVNGTVFASKAVTLDTNVNTITVGMRVKGTNISGDSNVLVDLVTSQSSITLTEIVSLSDNDVLTFESESSTINSYTFLEYPNITFYSPKADIQTAKGSYNSTTYTLFGGSFNFPANNLYFESENASSYTDGINTEAVMGDRFEYEEAIKIVSKDSDRNSDDGFMLEEYLTGQTFRYDDVPPHPIYGTGPWGNGDATSQTGGITLIRIFEPGDGYSKLPTASIKSEYGSGANVLATTTDIGRVQSVNITNTGFNYTEAPTLEFRANFVIKDITGSFATNSPLTSHTGRVRGYDSSTQVLNVSLEDRVRIFSEGSTSEGILLEENTFSQDPVSSAIIGTAVVSDENIYTDNKFRYGGRGVSLASLPITLDATSAHTELLLLEDGTDGATSGSVLLVEYENSTWTASAIASGLYQPQRFVLETFAGSDAASPYTWRRWSTPSYPISTNAARPSWYSFDKYRANAKISEGTGTFLVTDGTLQEVNIVLDGTDSSGTDAGGQLILNGTDVAGLNDGGKNVLILNGTDINSTDGGGVLLQDVEDFDNVVLDGTNSSSLHASGAVLNEVDGIDFSAGTTIISTATGSATIVNADVAKATPTLGITANKTGNYSGIEGLIGESLIRIQDSYYYQQFSYEVQTTASSTTFLDQLKKAIHPAGFNVFAKVLTTTFVSMGVTTTGAELGDEYVADTSTFTPILASTFEVLFDEVQQRRLSWKRTPADILLETSVNIIEGAEIVLEIGSIIIEAGGTDGDGTNAGDNIILNGTDSSSTDANRVIIIEAYSHDIGDSIELETAQYAYIDFEAIQIESSVESGSIGNLITNAGDRIVSESQEAISNRIVFNGTNDTHIFQADAGGQITLEDDSGSAIIESSISDGIGRIEYETTFVEDRLVDETNTIPFVREGTSGEGDVFLTSEITIISDTKIEQTHTTSSGLAFLAESATEGITGDGIELESGTALKGSRLLVTATTTLGTDAGSDMLLEDEADVNVGQSITIDTFTTIANDTMVLDGTDPSSTNAGDDLLLENPAGLHGGGKILGEDFNPEAYIIADISRDAHLDISDQNGNNVDDVVSIVLEGDELGTFKQEDETTVSTTFGDDILLEYNTGLQVGGKLQLERTPIILEDEINTGATPFGVYENSIIEPISYPSDIFVRNIGKLSLEDVNTSDEPLAGSKLLIDRTDGGGADLGEEFTLEHGTSLWHEMQSPASLNLGWSGTVSTGGISFDSDTHKWSANKYSSTL